MAEKRVVFEIEVDADNNIEAARTVQKWLQKDVYMNWQFYVQVLKVNGNNCNYFN